jgi:DNA-binding HxlR family transcriptional regulator
MLTLTLRQLERDGLVLRTVHATVPPRVDYALTPLGESVLEPLTGLMCWAQRHGTDIAEARAQYDAAQVDHLEQGVAG